MKRYIYYAIAVISAVVIINVWFFRAFYLKHISYQKDTIYHQAENFAFEIESAVLRFESGINKILFYEDVNNIFLDNESKNRSLHKLQIFYSVYEELIKNIFIYDNQKNVLNLFQDRSKNFITDFYQAQRQRKLEERDRVTEKDNLYQYSVPVFKDNQITANIVVTLDLSSYIQLVARKFYLENSLWQLITDDKGNLLAMNNGAIKLEKIPDELSKAFIEEDKGYLVHRTAVNGKKKHLISVYYPLTILNKEFGIIFSLNNAALVANIINSVLLAAFISLLLLLAVLFLFISTIRRLLEQKRQVEEEMATLSRLMENLPLGFIIMDSQRRVKSMNKAARDLLFIKSERDFEGKDLTERFMPSKAYQATDNSETAFDANQFILYQQEGNEVVIYKREKAFVVNNSDILIEAFIDVTEIEKSRKYEAAANTSKSEFLAKMSHEIRTPMNGIIGMTDALDQDNLTPSQKEYIQIVRKSADLLLSLIDDILDFSKIESGKMQLEEIPFRLSEEFNLALGLFRPIVEEKGLHLEIRVDNNVPDHLIGDPFRLRQVLSNLVSNAVKFTHEGQIVVSAGLEEAYNGNLVLRFTVEDTGVGIPKNKLESIFNSFTQADTSTSRKYGGSGLGTTISKQLVNLMHGEIWVESPSTISISSTYPGSRFSFTIELFSNEKLPKKLDFSSIDRIDRLKALIVARNEEDKKRLTNFFDFYKIAHFLYKYEDDKEEYFLNLIREGRNDFHLLVILDSPGFSGINIARLLKDNGLTDELLIYMLSSNHKIENYVKAKLTGIDHYLSQPFEYDDLIYCLQESFPQIKKIEAAEARSLKTDLKILVAEDNPINQKVAETIFKNLGYTIDIAVDGSEAVDMVKKQAYDIVFMDLIMPEKDGIQATVDIRGSGMQMPIVAMTATDSRKGKTKAITSGMNDYITKPIKADQLRKVLYKWFT